MLVIGEAAIRLRWVARVSSPSWHSLARVVTHRSRLSPDNQGETSIAKLGCVVADIVRVQRGFAQLAAHFARPSAHIPDSGDSGRTLVTRRELEAQLPQLPSDAAAVARALLHDEGDTLEQLRGLQPERWRGWRNAGELSLRDLHAASRGIGMTKESLTAQAQPIYERLATRIARMDERASSPAVDAMPDPLWREIARGIDRHRGNNDGVLGPDPSGLAREDEQAAVVAAITQREGITGLTPAHLTVAAGPGYPAAKALVDSFKARSPEQRGQAAAVLAVPISAFRDPATRAYARELSPDARSFPATFDAQGRPAAELATLIAAVHARGGSFPTADAWLLDRRTIERDATLIDTWLATLTPAQLFDFTSHGVFAQSFAERGAVSVADTREPPPGRWLSDAFVGTAGVIPRMPVTVDGYRAHYPNTLQQLGTAITSAQQSSLPVAHIVARADARQAALRARGETGASFDSHSMLGKEADSGWRAQTVPAQTMTELEALFRPTTQEPLSPAEQALIREGRLSRPEIVELRAVRGATRLFERSTPYGADHGGWTGNLWSEGLGIAGETNCQQEADTYVFFLQQLEDRGLLRHFAPSGRVRVNVPGIAPGLPSVAGRERMHAGALLVHRRTGDYFVVDSWIENGGEPAHVVPLATWLGHKYTASIVGAAGR